MQTQDAFEAKPHANLQELEAPDYLASAWFNIPELTIPTNINVPSGVRPPSYRSSYHAPGPSPGSGNGTTRKSMAVIDFVWTRRSPLRHSLVGSIHWILLGARSNPPFPG